MSHIVALDEYPLFGRINAENFTVGTAMVPSNNFDRITLFNMHCHRSTQLNWNIDVSNHTFSTSVDSDDFACKRDNLSLILFPQFSGHSPEDTRPDRVPVGINHHGGITIKANITAIGPSHGMLGPNDDTLVNLLVVKLAIGKGFLDGDTDYIAHARRGSPSLALPGTTPPQDLNTEGQLHT
jgi:hypothetical protein